MSIFLATLLIFSIVIALMSTTHLARQRTVGRSGGCAINCRGCTQANPKGAAEATGDHLP